MKRKSIWRTQGIGAGLNQRDLNIRAQMSIHGFSDAPVEDLVALLRSSQQIDTNTRMRLADALEGKSNGLILKVAKATGANVLRQVLRQAARLRQGRHVQRRTKEIGYRSAIAELAQAMAKSDKAAERCVTLANAVDSWIKRVRAEMPEYTDYSDADLEIAFIDSGIRKRAPELSFDADLKYTIYIVRTFENYQNRALAPSEWFLT
jgi:hypothetical protein